MNGNLTSATMLLSPRVVAWFQNHLNIILIILLQTNFKVDFIIFFLVSPFHLSEYMVISNLSYLRNRLCKANLLNYLPKIWRLKLDNKNILQFRHIKCWSALIINFSLSCVWPHPLSYTCSCCISFADRIFSIRDETSTYRWSSLSTNCRYQFIYLPSGPPRQNGSALRRKRPAAQLLTARRHVLYACTALMVRRLVRSQVMQSSMRSSMHTPSPWTFSLEQVARLLSVG
jgi:hypothetical protein